jgi:chromate transporter
MGLFLAGSCFILSAFLIVIGIAWAYVRFGHLPQVTGVLYGVKPVVIAIVFQALWNLSRTAMRTRLLAGIGIVATISAFAGTNPLLMLLGTGLLVGDGQWVVERKKGTGPILVLMLFIGALMTIPLLFRKYMVASSALGLSSLFLVFAKLGSVVYGSGYVLLAFLRSDLVTQRGWLTSTQLLDAVAVGTGQVQPGLEARILFPWLAKQRVHPGFPPKERVAAVHWMNKGLKRNWRFPRQEPAHYAARRS